MVDPSDPFHDSRPSGVLPAKSGFSVAKFLGLTVALAAGAGAGIGGYILLQRRAPEDNAQTVEDDGEPAAKEDVPPAPNKDVPSDPEAPEHGDGRVRLDIPHHPSNVPSSPGGEEPGPDVEVPAWD